ncbi:MAG: biotin--[acetyl-CoA-carboxylase] ligase [Prevotella sp.]|nr:biotin--[acetyl-CoA-carboxylase] ligase [Prevotella sp.]
MLSIRSLFKKKKVDDGIRFIHLDDTDSTNRYCLEEFQDDTTAPLSQSRMVVVTADYQSAGKGQGTNTWESERGQNLLFSILCHPVWVPIMGQFIISECIALAIRDTLSTYTDGFSIKWPNDIYWHDRKICGILIENRLSARHIKDCVVGVGIDVNQLEFHSDAPNPISLRQILGHEIDRTELLKSVVTAFDRYLQAVENGDYAAVATAYASYLYRSHGFYPYRDGQGYFEAAIVEVEDDGHLILRDREGHIRSYAFKEVEFVLEGLE